jgi:hypothetical protein
MKTIFSIFLLLAAIPCFAQPTGHQKIFLEVSDNGQIIPFEDNFSPSKVERLNKVVYKNYVLYDEGRGKTGFGKYSRGEYFYKTLMTDNAHLRLVRNKTDTMNIEIRDAFDVFFLKIPFQKGDFRLILSKKRWYQTVLPKKTITGEQNVYDITPSDWTLFKVAKDMPEADYRLAKLYLNSQNPAAVTIPEDDPNFRNQKKLPPSKREVGDFNFDKTPDYREQVVDSYQWNYFIFNTVTNAFELDTALSSLDMAVFDFKNQKFAGNKTVKVDNLTTRMEYYEFIDGKITMTKERICTQKSENSERSDCVDSELENGVWIFKRVILGAE